MAHAKRATRGAAKPTPDTRWFKLRMEHVGISQRELADRLGIAPSLVGRAIGASSMSRSGGFRTAELRLVASALQVTVDELLERLGCGRSEHAWTIDAELDATSRVRPIAQPIRVHVAPRQYVELRGIELLSSLVPGYPSGTTIFVNPAPRHPAECVGRLCVLNVRDEPLQVVGALDTARRGLYTVHLFVGSTQLHSVHVEQAHLVEWIQLNEATRELMRLGNAPKR